MQNNMKKILESRDMETYKECMKHQSYMDIVNELKDLPITRYPDLIRRLIITAYEMNFGVCGNKK